MKKYLEYKTEMEGYKEVLSTIKTVEKIAASQIQQLKQKTDRLLTYTESMELILSRFSLFHKEEMHPLFKPHTSKKKTGYLLVGSDKGLVGSLYHQLGNYFLQKKDFHSPVFVLGKEETQYLKEEGREVTQNFPNPPQLPTPDYIGQISSLLAAKFVSGDLSEIRIIYQKFLSLVEYQPVEVPFLPLSFSSGNPSAGEIGLPIFVSPKKTFFGWFLSKYTELFISRILFESKLCELSARTIAMEHASTKAQEMINRSLLLYSKERRRRTTQRQLESFSVHNIYEV